MNKEGYINEAEKNILHTYNRFSLVLDHGEGVYLYGCKRGGKYRLYSITRDSYQMFVEKDKVQFTLKARNAGGTYYFRVRSYAVVKGKLKYSAYSKTVKVSFS